ncbi:DEAD/DEAH box helicase [Corynebacterium caspium]|uniref:DEAD/DEAH box helicase n=1 Tax=Corynebacterium caspium TaxID=234828 RepID=UPI00036395B2|nr:RNA helicase [Corynebacterium caspium]WKD59307.1 ski2-like helicase [Corynebacterium caspium DSM 44850]
MSNSHLEAFLKAHSFPLDPFQIAGCEAIEQGRGVLVCAPTGAGKTIVGEFAVSLALSSGTRCFYTTPIKALSNQKFNDLVAVHGPDAVGLMTGDQSINGDAQIIVMTTEVLRNMIYAQSSALAQLSHVVMDEIHYLGDRSRGGVWEEVILNLDESVIVVGLSATVSNSEEFGEWLSTVRGDTDVIVTEHRPVPLHQWMTVNKRLYPLFEPGDDSGQLNKQLSRAIAKISLPDDEPPARGGFRARSDRGSHSDTSNTSDASEHKESTYRRTRWEKRSRRNDARRPHSRPGMLQILKQHEMLPAITFIFSRAGCEGALYQCLRSDLVLTNQQEANEIAAIIDAGVADIPRDDLEVLNFRQWRAALMRGFAAHHAGMLPAFRHIVEKLFVKGLLKAVFATETLALGINMPARSVVLEKTVKYNGEAHVELTPGEYTQLTGRAGRRGIDTVGHAVVQWTPAVDPQQLAGLASTRTYPLISTFAPGYNMSINLLKAHGYQGAITLLESSFAQFQSNGSVVEEARTLERARQRVRQLETQLQTDMQAFGIAEENASSQLEEYISLRLELAQEEKEAKKVARAERFEEVTRILSKLQFGEVIAMPTKKRPLLAVVVSPASQAQDPRPLVIAETGWSGRIEVGNFARPPLVLGKMRLPRETARQPKRNIRYIISAFKKQSYKRPKNMNLQPRTRPNATITELRTQIKAHPVHHWAATDREQLARVAEKLIRRRREAEKLQQRISTATDTLGRTFSRILELLQEMDYVEVVAGQPQVSAEGERLAEIHNEADLLVAQCLKRGIWDDLDPAELAGVVSLCVFENRKEVSGEGGAVTEEMATAMEQTWRVWKELHSDESRYRLPYTRLPDSSFALAAHQWTAGAPLSYTLNAAAESGAELSPGDFVRWCRRLIDLLEQVAKTGYTPEIKQNARAAVEAIQRGVVAIGT